MESVAAWLITDKGSAVPLLGAGREGTAEAYLDAENNQYHLLRPENPDDSDE